MRRLRLYFILLTRRLWRRRGLWLRALMGCVLGIGLLTIDRQSGYDLRFRLRGKQSVDSSIVILAIDNSAWRSWQHLSKTAPIGDMYRNPKAWKQILDQLVSERPLAVGVTTYFAPNVSSETNSPLPSVFSNWRIIWAAQLTEGGHVWLPPFASPVRRNFGLVHFVRDRDGVIRRFGTASERVPNIAVLMARRLPNVKISSFNILKSKEPIINYRGDAGTFAHIGLTKFLNHDYPQNFFKHKLVIIGTPDLSGAELHTPLGQMSTAEILANIIDNIHYDRWIKRPPFAVLALFIILLVMFSAWLTSRYPQFLAFFILIWLNIFYVTFSLWLFDVHYLWLPILPAVAATFGTYVIFLSFQLTLKDYLTQQLENEHQFLLGVEQLKNNFLSLISHDLRTPIAKIQAICDRLLAENPQIAVAPDLASLREVATELNRYIGTIIQITRVESKDFRINKDATDINELIVRAKTSVEPLAAQKKIHIETNLEPMFLIEVDAVLIHEVILNLIENAIKYTPEGGRVGVSSQEVDGRVIVMVEDSGVGIPETEQAHVFEKFFRGEHGKSHPRGSGLGLYLVKYFVELHGGQIILKSQVGVGTKIGFSLPIDDQPEPELAHEEGATNETHA